MTLRWYVLSGLLFGGAYMLTRLLSSGRDFGATTIEGPFDMALLVPVAFCGLVAFVTGWVVERAQARKGRVRTPR